MQFLKITNVTAPPSVPAVSGLTYPLEVEVTNIRKAIVPFVNMPLKCIVAVDSVHPGDQKCHVESEVTVINSGEVKTFAIPITIPALAGLNPPFVDNHIVTAYWVLPWGRRAHDTFQFQIEKVGSGR